MSKFNIVKSRSVRLAAAAAAVAVTLTGLAAAPASAHGPTPVPGAKCMMSGMVDVHGTATFVCTKNTNGKTTWSKTPASTAKLAVAASDTWVKATKKGQMTGAFGMLKNTSGKPIQIVGVSSPYAMAVQMHEMATKDGAMVMQEKVGGFTIPAGGMLELKPGGNHLMFMGVKKTVKPGTLVPVTLIASDGSKLTVKMLGKTFTGANEEYPGGSGHMGATTK